jgi:anthranilate synthase component 1
MVIFDNLSQRVKVVSSASPGDDGGEEAAREAAQARIAKVLAAVRRAGPGLRPFSVDESVEVKAELAPEARDSSYPKLVEAAKEYVKSGDVFQLVLSQPFEQDAGDLDPLSVYRTLRFTNPAPYMYLLELPSATLVGASPEVLVRVEPTGEGGERRVTVRPIAGTRRRGKDRAEDEALERELLADPKERAEHLMLIDLGRNDVGRIAKAGSVKCRESFVIERYSRVMHIVSEVCGTLRDDHDALDALRATFPAGTLSGAPKVRALQLIDELEATERGWYGGAVGYFGFDGGADFAICIRSVVARKGKLRVQAGAGLVYDSVPEAEDDECHRKASAVVRAIAMARESEAKAKEEA